MLKADAHSFLTGSGGDGEREGRKREYRETVKFALLFVKYLPGPVHVATGLCAVSDTHLLLGWTNQADDHLCGIT